MARSLVSTAIVQIRDTVKQSTQKITAMFRIVTIFSLSLILALPSVAIASRPRLRGANEVTVGQCMDAKDKVGNLAAALIQSRDFKAIESVEDFNKFRPTGFRGHYRFIVPDTKDGLAFIQDHDALHALSAHLISNCGYSAVQWSLDRSGFSETYGPFDDNTIGRFDCVAPERGKDVVTGWGIAVCT